jgi:hypothetical protein
LIDLRRYVSMSRRTGVSHPAEESNVVMDTRERETTDEAGAERSKPHFATRHAVFAVPVVVALVYVLCTVMWNAPGSPAKTRVQGELDVVMKPYFVQTWTLFAPNPPTFNTDGWYQVRYTADGMTRETPAYSLTDPYRRTSRRVPGLWSLVGHEAEALGTQLAQAAQARRAHPLSEAPDVAGFELGRQRLSAASADQQWADDLYEAQRLASRMADSLGLARSATQVRVFYTITGIPTPTADSEPNPIGPEPSQSADSGWLAYVPEARR